MVTLFQTSVDTFETAKIILQINKEIKGATIHIYPIEWIEKLQIKERNYPQCKDVIPLINQIKLNPNVQCDLTPILRLVFGKAMLVRNYEVANRYAKDSNLHCVTPDGQIVYGGGFIIRAGFHDTKKEKIAAYLEY